MYPLASILALLIGIAGWYYLFNSDAAERLGAIEEQRLNRRRVRLRRAGGFVLLLLAPTFFAGFNTVSPESSPQAFAAVWLTVMVLLAVTVVFALIDVRLTWKLRRQQQGGDVGSSL